MPKTKDFIELQKAVKRQYLGKKVPKKYQKKYGKRYDPKEVKSIGYAIAKKKKIKIHKKKRKGGKKWNGKKEEEANRVE